MELGWRTGAESLVNCFFFVPYFFVWIYRIYIYIYIYIYIGYMRAEKYRICMGTNQRNIEHEDPDMKVSLGNYTTGKHGGHFQRNINRMGVGMI